MAADPLTRKQRMFVGEYLVDFNATQAAIRAGYSAKTADRIGAQLLGKTWVAEAVREAMANRSKATQIDAEWVLTRLRDNVERSMQAEPVVDRLGMETGLYTYQGAVANKALELLGKHVGLFVDRTEHTGDGGGPITIAVTHRVIDADADA